MIPLPYRIAAACTFILATFGSGFYAGSARVQKAWNEAKAVQAQQKDYVQAAQAEVSVQTVTKYVDRIKTVTAPAQEVLRAIPTYLPVDSECPAAGRIGLLVNAAETGVRLPASPGPVDGPAPTPQAVAEWGVGIVEACRANAEQLTALQEWVRAQGAVQ